MSEHTGKDSLGERQARVLFFGCYDDLGHFLHEEKPKWRKHLCNGKGVWPFIPFKKIDGGLAPQDNRQVQGQAALHHSPSGWTAIAWWDRSVDTRGGSNCAFFIDREVGFDDALALARERWPEVFERFGYEVNPVPQGAANRKETR